MKTILLAGAAAVLLSSLAGCVVAPVPEPVVYRPLPPPPPVVVVRPAYSPYYYGPRPYYRRWR